ncbi:MAG: acetyl-CoA C-acyltransferase [Candidatus Geothermincolia bacterium]
MRQSVIVDSARTAFGRLGGGLADLSAQELGTVAIKGVLERSGIDPNVINCVVGGHVLTAGQGQMTPRQSAVAAGIPKDKWSVQINKVCISSLYALEHADMLIKLGRADAVMVVGQESMSGAPYLVPKARFGYRMGDAKIIDAMIKDGLWDAFEDIHMGLGTDRWAAELGITREQMDLWSARSHQRAAAAQAKGYLAEEIVPVEIAGKKGTVVVDADEGIRPDTTVETLAKLRPAFAKEGAVTAGNASSINDGACAALVMSEEKAKELGFKPLARIVEYGWNAGDYTNLHVVPAQSMLHALSCCGKKPQDLEVIEINEAFASVCWHSAKMLGLDPETAETINPNGGAIALGHPIGASGLRIITTLAYELRRRGGGLGAAGICGGGGQGDSMIISVD